MNTNHNKVNSNENLIDLDSFTRAIATLRQDSESLQQTYNSGQPYPHLAIDDLFEPAILDRIVAEFPRNQDRDWIVWDSNYELKTTSRGIAGLSPFTQFFCLWLNSSEFIDELKKITGIQDLIPDPLFFGAGLHEMYRDGWLDIHADYTKHPTLPLIRRINLLIYLNRDWDPSWGGEIELWSETDTEKRVGYTPHFNRTVIFPTTSETLHGVPKRLSCPPEQSRKLISIYYWSPAPSLIKAGTPIIWSSEQSWQKKLRKVLRNIATNISGDKGNGFGL
ncbi:proline hydroxylase-like protein [Stanieria sp. NIES-3757]|nr:proline hydroxylase-like protein [Stanieria sp. NIES-3757]